MAERHVPLSVRYGNRRKRLGWKWKLAKERFALWLCPWLTPPKALDPEVWAKRVEWELRSNDG